MFDVTGGEVKEKIDPQKDLWGETTLIYGWETPAGGNGLTLAELNSVLCYLCCSAKRDFGF